MTSNTIAQGLSFHDIPPDLEQVLISEPTILEKWNSLTPIQRNEWICRVTIVKQEKTRHEHLVRLSEELSNPQGKRSPCCRPGCPHRKPQTQQYFK